MIPNQRPLLPSTDKLLPYLRRIDQSRYYSNIGHLVIEFEERLSELFNATCITSSSATSALTTCLLALELPRASLVACPSWTFAATPAAIIAAGHIPYFVDCLSDFEEINFDKIPLHRNINRIKAIIAVSPFGAPMNMEWWENKREEFGIPVILDAAAGFDTFSTYPLSKPNNIPVVISTHATKAFGTGEGGFVACNDKAFLQKVRHLSNFGMDSERKIECSGLNAKMSEYHAAVGLAGLDEWPQRRKQWLQVREWYNLELRITGEYATATAALGLEIPGKTVAERMKRAGVDAKTGVYGCHLQLAFMNYPRGEMTATEELMDKTIYLPIYSDMTEKEVIEVCDTLRKCMRESMI